MNQKREIYITVSDGSCHDNQTFGPYPSFDAAYQAGEEICEGSKDLWYQAHHGPSAPDFTNSSVAHLERNHQ